MVPADRTVVLNAEQWQIVLNAIAERPFREVHEIIPAIVRQVNEQHLEEQRVNGGSEATDE